MKIDLPCQVNFGLFSLPEQFISGSYSLFNISIAEEEMKLKSQSLSITITLYRQAGNLDSIIEPVKV